MYRNQARRWQVYLMLAGIIFCTTSWYVLDVQPSQAQSEGTDVIGLATVPTALTVPATNTPKPTRTPKPTKTATQAPTQTAVPPTPTATATETATGIATQPTVPPPATETPTGIATQPTVPPPATETPTGIATQPTVPPPATETPTGIATVPTVAPTVTETPTIIPTAPTATPPTNPIFLSSSDSGKVDGGKFSDEDIFAYNRETDTWAMVVDGSDLGLHRLDLTDFYLMADGSILMNFNKSVKLPNLGRVDDSDIVRFIPTKLGSETAGSFEWFFDGSDVGLKSDSEDIDAIAFTPAGELVISTKGSFQAGDLRGKDEDLFVLRNGILGEETSGTWELYFDGSAFELTKGNEDIDGAWIDQATGKLYLTTKGDFKAVWQDSNIQGDRNDIFICIPTIANTITGCTFQSFFDGNSVRMTKRIDGFAIGAPANLATLLPWVTTMDEDDGVVENQYLELEDDEVDDVDGATIDEEIDDYDLEDEAAEESTLLRVIFLPLINK